MSHRAWGEQVERGLSQSQKGLDTVERVECSPPVDLVEAAERCKNIGSAKKN
jgi:hypothetical protein